MTLQQRMDLLLEVDLLNEQTILPYITKTSNFDWVYGEEITRTKLRLMYLNDHELFHTNFSSVYLAKNIDERLEEHGLTLRDSHVAKVLVVMLIEDSVVDIAKYLSPIISESSLIELLSWWGMNADLVYSFIVTRDVTKELRDHIEALGFGTVLDRRIPKELFGIVLSHCNKQTGTALLLTCKDAYEYKGKIEWKMTCLEPCSVDVSLPISILTVINTALGEREFSKRELKYIRHQCNHYELFGYILSNHAQLVDTFVATVGHKRNSEQKLQLLFHCASLSVKKITWCLEMLNL